MQYYFLFACTKHLFATLFDLLFKFLGIYIKNVALITQLLSFPVHKLKNYVSLYDTSKVYVKTN